MLIKEINRLRSERSITSGHVRDAEKLIMTKNLHTHRSYFCISFTSRRWIINFGKRSNSVENEVLKFVYLLSSHLLRIISSVK